MPEPTEIYQVYRPVGKNLDEIADDLVVQVNEQLQLIAEKIATESLVSDVSIGTLADSATPSVQGKNTWRTGGTTAITDFLGAVKGQLIYLISKHSVTLTHSTGLVLNGDTDYAMTDGDTIILLYDLDENWYEMGRGGVATATGPFTIGGTTYDDAEITDDGTFVINTTDGVVEFEEDGTGQFAYLQLFPGAAANQGAIIALHVPVAHDTNITSYGLQVYQDDLYLGPTTNPNSMKYHGGIGKWIIEDPMEFVEAIKLLEKSADPSEPAEGECVVWMSDGNGKGADGDIMIASKAGGTTNYGTLFDHSGGAGW